ncbi:Sporulation-specific protease yabG [[Clostridium] ultunense Esp]|uniref:sporulation peptidase YabG n=1 Tax=Thermicanus aegyptius TaxID=94009 RepID=UPI0002B6FE7F|nr:sporulation peptidase YabG [Thermicanus aegyptius]CCQ98205.1 Sporulation-specific protease yabG [[Clostridium] ultunense Esp]
MKKGIKVGNVVVRKSYGKDILFRVIFIQHEDNMAVLKGIDWRLIADSPLDDLEVVKEEEDSVPYRDANRNGGQIKPVQYMKPPNRPGQAYHAYPGKVLHMDGDARYLALCMGEYERLGIPAVGVHMEEREIPRAVLSLLTKYQPDILVITGHDSYRNRERGEKDLKSYRNSHHFMEAVRRARTEYERHKDNLIIFAGACQSYYEGMMDSGANFASSPGRVNIHALDPVRVVEKISYTSIRETVPLLDAIQFTKAGNEGIGGIETRGTMRLAMPD